jgi:hypothetical protein
VLEDISTEREKNNYMKMNTKLALVLGTAVLAATTAVAKPAHHTLHFSIHTALTDTGVEPGSAGNVSATEVKNGSKLNQNLVVTVSGLTTNSAYVLSAVTNGGSIDLDAFNTDNNGKATLHLRTGNGHGKNTVALPDGFELGSITELNVVGGHGAVLTTTGATPKSVQYSLKKPMDSTVGAKGTLEIKANVNKTTLNIDASGLTSGATYQLVINGTPVSQTYTADSKGRLKVKNSTLGNPLDISTVEIWDSSNTAVLTTTVP